MVRRFSLLKSLLCFTFVCIFFITYLSRYSLTDKSQSKTVRSNPVNKNQRLQQNNVSSLTHNEPLHNSSSIPPSPTPSSHHSINYLHLTLSHIPNSQFTSMTAYYDNREAFHGPSIIVLGYQQRKAWDKVLYCTVYYEDGSVSCIPDPTTVELADPCNKYIRYAPSISVVHICKLSSHTPIPTHVSVSVDNCPHEGSVKLTVTNTIESQSMKAEFGICVQTPLYGKVSKQDIYEFIEIHKLLGVSVFTFYTQTNMDHFSSLSKWYNDLYIDVLQWPSVFKRTTPVHYYGELLAIHDCLYRNMHKVKYLAFIDIDEVIVPIQDHSLSQMMEQVSANSNTAGYTLDNVLMSIHDTIPIDTLTKLQHSSLCDHVQIPKYIQTYQRYACEYKHPRRSKVIVHPDRVTHLDIHSICHHKLHSKVIVPHDIGLLYHYRSSVPSDCKERELVEAKQLYNYTQQLLLQLDKRFCH